MDHVAAALCRELWLVLTFDADDAPYHHAPIWQRCPPLLWTLSRWRCFWCLRKKLRSKLGRRRWWRGLLFVRPPFVVPKCNELVGDSRGRGSTRVACSEKVWSVCSRGRWFVVSAKFLLDDVVGHETLRASCGAAVPALTRGGAGRRAVSPWTQWGERGVVGVDVCVGGAVGSWGGGGGKCLRWVVSTI